MKRIIAFSAFTLFLVLSATAQTINLFYAPTSVKVWGHTPKVSMTALSADFRFDWFIFDGIEAGLLYINHHYNNADNVTIDNGGNPLSIPVSNINDSFGFYTLPLNFKQKIKWIGIELSVGAAYFIKRVPTAKGRSLNAVFRGAVSINFSKLLNAGLSYMHISNVWTGQVNTGYDFPSISLSLNL